MKISVDIDVDGVVQLTAAVLRQLPYAANNAITRTAKEAVEGGIREAIADLTIRTTFVAKRIKILQYSRVSNLTAVIGVDTKVQGSPVLLGFLEDGGDKTPQHGDELAIPLTGEKPRPTFAQKVPTSYKYLNLRINQAGKGRAKTFVVPGVGIFQRVAPGRAKESTVLIYSFKPSVRLPKHLQLREAMLKIIGERFNPIFTEEFTNEILKRARR